MNKNLKEILKMIDLGEFAPGSRSRRQEQFDIFIVDQLIRARKSFDTIIKEAIHKFPDMNNFIIENSNEDIKKYFDYIQMRRVETIFADNFMQMTKKKRRKS